MIRRLFVAAQLLACRPAVPEAPRACDGTIADAGWLAGAWVDREGTRVTEETWVPAAGGTMLGVGRTLVAGRTTFFEFMRIEARADGVVFVAHPSGGPGVEFRLTTCGPGALRFENPGHDFPQRLEYRRAADGSVRVEVGGVGEGGGWQGSALEYRRVDGV